MRLYVPGETKFHAFMRGLIAGLGVLMSIIAVLILLAIAMHVHRAAASDSVATRPAELGEQNRAVSPALRDPLALPSPDYVQEALRLHTNGGAAGAIESSGQYACKCTCEKVRE